MTLDAFIDKNRAELITRARAKVSSRSSPQASTAELEQGVPIFLSQLCATLKDVVAHGSGRSEPPSPTVTPAISKSAASHGLTLFKLGFTIEQVVHDYGDICQAVTELAEKLGTNLSIVEFQTLNRCLDNAIAGAVTSWSRGREDVTTDESVAEKESRVPKLELLRLLDQADAAIAVLRTGTVGIDGATGGVLRRSLLDLRAAIDKGR